MALHLLSFACYPDCIMMSPVKISLSRKTSHANGRVIGIFSKKYGFWKIMKTSVKQNIRQI